MKSAEKTNNMNTKIAILFPHQLFENHRLFDLCDVIYLVEEELFFNQYPFHKQKIAYHRASMKFYENYLVNEKQKEVIYVDAQEKNASIAYLLKSMCNQNIKCIHYIDVVDNWLDKRLKSNALKFGIELVCFENTSFLNNTSEELSFFDSSKKKFFQTKFYTEQRLRFNILMTDEAKPEGDKWTFDAENRKRFPKNKIAPTIKFPSSDGYFEEAKNYVMQHFATNYGELLDYPLYPHNFEEAKIWLDDFLEQRFYAFGDYEDAILLDEHFLFHSVLSPMLNNGLLTPDYVIDRILNKYHKNEGVPINACEGIIRQIIGWREFIRGVYITKGTLERTVNFWDFSIENQMPKSFYTADTGIIPVDKIIQKILKTGYCHHIERLMVLGNFMLLSEIHPNAVYKWFMEFFIDAYDWVMVPNVYGMSQFADGGVMSTKPYLSGSNYIMKMSDAPKGDWQEIWDALFWRFIDKRRSFFLKNPRTAMMVRNFDKMEVNKKQHLLSVAEDYLKTIRN